VSDQGAVPVKITVNVEEPPLHIVPPPDKVAVTGVQVNWLPPFNELLLPGVKLVSG
jgi:hypothetical protein